ncbi:MAG: hydroxyacylglutathione hydrolase [Hyphomicrobiaceae bacterium]
MTSLEIVLLPCLSDNYCVLLHAPSGETAAIDAPDATAIEQALDARDWKLTDLFITHHHNDHTGGIAALKERYNCTVTGPAGEADRISGLDRTVSEATPFTWAGHNVRVIETPGHTLGHIVYVLPDENLAFTGDTLFAMGCGRIFEGDAEGMWNAIEKLMSLPNETTIYCGHEYTAANGRFAQSLEPENQELTARMARVTALRAENKPTVPTTMALEKATNPFLRVNSSAIRARLGLERAPEWAVFQRLRELKNKA